MAFAFNLGGDDIDLEDESLEAQRGSQDRLSYKLSTSAHPIRHYCIGDTDLQSESTRSFVSNGSFLLFSRLLSTPGFLLLLPSDGFDSFADQIFVEQLPRSAFGKLS